MAQRQTHAHQLDRNNVAELHDQADQARYDSQHTWQYLNRPSPTPIPTPRLATEPEPAAEAVPAQHPHPTMQLQPGGPPSRAGTTNPCLAPGPAHRTWHRTRLVSDGKIHPVGSCWTRGGPPATRWLPSQIGISGLGLCRPCDIDLNHV